MAQRQRGSSAPEHDCASKVLEIRPASERRSTWPNESVGLKHPSITSWLDARTFASPSGQSVFGGIFILVNVTIGLSTLSMPYTFKLVGQVMIPIMLILGAICVFTAYLIHKAVVLSDSLVESEQVPVESRDWGYLAELAFGNVGYIIASVTFRGELIASILSFLCALAVHLNLLFPTVSIETGVLLSSVATLIMSYLPDYLISKVALFANCAYAIVVSCFCYSQYVALRQPDAPDITELVSNNWHNSIGIMEALPNIPTVVELCVFSWAGHTILPNIKSSMARPSNVKSVISVGFSVIVGLSMVIGLGGFLTLGPNTKQVFTQNLGEVYWKNRDGELLPELYWMRPVACALMTVKLATTIPCWMHPLLTSMEVGIRNPFVRFFSRTLLVACMGMAACVFRSRVVLAVAFAGATFDNMVVFILPCVVYYGIKRRVASVGRVEAVLLSSIVALGVMLMFFGIYDCLAQLINPEFHTQSSHSKS